jgi:hypothetical protein
MISPNRIINAIKVMVSGLLKMDGGGGPAAHTAGLNSIKPANNAIIFFEVRVRRDCMKYDLGFIL